MKLLAVVVLSIFYATTLFSSFAAAGDDAWYFARFGKEKCIAIADVDVEKSQRLYGELGDMEYPGDVGAAFQRLGFTVTQTGLKPHLIRIKATVSRKKPINILLIRGEEFCRFLMLGVGFGRH